MDNASNNNTLIKELSKILDDFQGEVTHVWCFAHIFNLVVKVCNMLLFILYLFLTDLSSHIGYPLTVQ